MKILATTRNTDPYILSNDENGFSVYGFVLFATPEQCEAVQKVRNTVRVRRSMLPAHVTVKGPVCDTPSIKAVQAILDQITGSVSRIRVQFGEEITAKTLPNDEVIGTQSIQVTPELAALHIRLIEALNPISVTAYKSESEGVFRPHLTVYHEPEPGLEQIGEQMLTKLHIGNEFLSDRISLMGHVGTPFRGEWKLISEHKFIGH